MSIRFGVVLLGLALTACEGNGKPAPTGCFQVPTESLGWSWSTEGFQTGAAKSEEFLDVAIDSQGRLYLAGYENGDVGTERFDPSGDSRGVLWRLGAGSSDVSRSFDLPGTTESLDALTFHPVTGALYFAGRTTGAFDRAHGASADFTHLGQQDVFVGSEQDGVLYQGGSARPQHPNRIAFDAQGALIVSGFDDYYVPSGTAYVERWDDPFFIKLERPTEGLTLNERWFRSFDTSAIDRLGGLAVDTRRDSSIYVTGNAENGSTRGSFVQRIDPGTGEPGPLWRQSTISMDSMEAALFREDGNLIIAGSTFGVMGPRSSGEQDVVVRLLNMDPEKGAIGEPLWTKQYGSPGADFVTDMAVDAQGNIIVVGETLDSVLEQDPTANKGGYDIFMMKLDANGDRLDVKQWGSAGDDHPNAVAVDACGEAFIVGYTTGPLLSSSAQEGERDAFLITTARRRE
ncbi:SBBP repeat-containing protein [Archangium violaceum]|uniref:SBBP repeat-containing protein n=1 Tax=Archangium violaceum TaxID=83451 RepID=UPI0036DC79FA